MASIAELVRMHRARLDMKQEDLAKRARLTRNTIVAVESGASPNFATLEKIAKALGVEVRVLFEAEKPEGGAE